MDKSFKTEENLIVHLQNGDENAFSFLLEKYHHQLCIYAKCLTKDHDQAEDIVQNVFIRTWELRERLNDKLSLKSFLYRSTYNEFIDQYRKRKSVITLEKKYIEVIDKLVDDNDSERLNALLAAVKLEIENLPPRCKEVFILSKKEGLTNLEISEYMNISIKAVEAQITKAFVQLRKKMGDKLSIIIFLLFCPQNRIASNQFNSEISL